MLGLFREKLCGIDNESILRSFQISCNRSNISRRVAVIAGVGQFGGGGGAAVAPGGGAAAGMGGGGLRRRWQQLGYGYGGGSLAAERLRQLGTCGSVGSGGGGGGAIARRA